MDLEAVSRRQHAPRFGIDKRILQHLSEFACSERDVGSSTSTIQSAVHQAKQQQVQKPRRARSPSYYSPEALLQS
jgi:hypothetical protein